MRGNNSIDKLVYFQLDGDEYDEIIGGVGSKRVIPVPPANQHETKIRLRYGAGIGLVLSLVVISLLTMHWQRSTVLMGSTLSKTLNFRQVDHPDPPTSLWGTVSKPYPTGAFWTNLVVNNGDWPVQLSPYAVKTLVSGVQISYSAARRIESQAAITDYFGVDLQLTSVEPYLSHGVVGFDNISVTMQYTTISNGKFTAYLVKGAPFITISYQGTTPSISSIMHILSVSTTTSALIPGASGTDSQFIVTLGNYQQWLVYTPASITLTWNGDTLTASAPIHGIIRVINLPLPNTIQVVAALQPYLAAYPTGGSVVISYPASQQASINFNFNVVGKGQLLMFALPHHVSSMTSPIATDPVVVAALSPVYSMKGLLRPVVGSSWKLTINLVSVGWNYDLATPISNDQLDTIAAQLMDDVNNVIPNAEDVYSFAKQMGRMGQLALLADSLGLAEQRQQALATMETSFIPWLQGTAIDSFVYDKTYGGVLTTFGIADVNAEFGSGWYNDHHFHFGYLAFAAAVISRFDVAFHDSNAIYFDTIIRDICTMDSTDSQFPFARHKDLFDGHSWATGILSQGNGKNQESSSEAVNAYYGCYLYGLATANVDLTQFALTLLTMEIQGARTYWHVPNGNIYGNFFAGNAMVGNVGGLDVTASTWFGDSPEYVHGINMMPLTPATSALFNQEYVALEWPVLGYRLKDIDSETRNRSPRCANNPGCANLTGLCCPDAFGKLLGCCQDTVGFVSEEWISYIYNIQAVINRDSAWRSLQSLQDFGAGGSLSNCLYWAASRPPPPANANNSVHAPEFVVTASCSENVACAVEGLQGNCCPVNGLGSTTEQNLGCCPLAPTL